MVDRVRDIRHAPTSAAMEVPRNTVWPTNVGSAPSGPITHALAYGYTNA